MNNMKMSTISKTRENLEWLLTPVGTLRRCSNHWWELVDRNHTPGIKRNVGLATLTLKIADCTEAYVT